MIRPSLDPADVFSWRLCWDKGPALYLAFSRGSAFKTFQTFQKGPALYLAFVFADAGHLTGEQGDDVIVLSLTHTFSQSADAASKATTQQIQRQAIKEQWNHLRSPLRPGSKPPSVCGSQTAQIKPSCRSERTPSSRPGCPEPLLGKHPNMAAVLKRRSPLSDSCSSMRSRLICSDGVQQSRSRFRQVRFYGDLLEEERPAGPETRSTAPYQDQIGALSSQLNPDLTRPSAAARHCYANEKHSAGAAQLSFLQPRRKVELARAAGRRGAARPSHSGLRHRGLRGLEPAHLVRITAH
ncbi:unnamed protein product [Boreogadus saida]